jgi:hypothetical protein
MRSRLTRSGTVVASLGTMRVLRRLVLICCLVLPWQASAESTKRETQAQVHADYARLAGKWQRADGGYVLELEEAKPDGQLKAFYFNPRAINVSKAEWRRMGDTVQVFVELRDVNYPGSTYLLVYAPENDRLEGYYHQAALGQTFDVVFEKIK